MVFPPLRACLAVAATFFFLASCGAGVITAVVGAKDESGNNADASTPALTAPVDQGPLVPDPPAFRRVIIRDVVLPPNNFTVELRWQGATSEQAALILSEDPTPQTTVVHFSMRTLEIVDKLADEGIEPWDMDVGAELAVLADGVEVAPPIPFTLLRQPTATLVPPDPRADEVFLSPLGGERLTLLVGGLRSDAEVEDLGMVLVTRDPADALQLLFLECTNLAKEDIPASDDVLVSGLVPSHAFPGEVATRVTDSMAGSSPFVTRAVYYRPEVGSTAPAAGPTDGGTLVTLSGTAMVPLEFPPPGEGGEGSLAFDKVSIEFRKGDRKLTLPATDLRREESSHNRLVFPMPPSPDGRPGSVGVVLKANLGPQNPEAQDLGLFFYGDSAVGFGPRGAILNRAPIAVETVSIEERPTDGPDAVLLTEVAGVPVVQLYGSAENGMFHRSGLSLQAGDLTDPTQRAPVDLTAGNFDGVPTEDVIVINAGQGAGGGHTLVVGRAPQSSPLLQKAGLALSTNAAARRSVAGDLDRDGDDDLVVLAQAGSAPEVFLAYPSGPGEPGFGGLGHPPVGEGPFHAISLDDLDGDSILDLCLARGGLDPQAVIAYGTGLGGFEAVESIDLSAMVGYVGDPRSEAVGVHACGSTPKSVAVVFAGVPGSGVTEPTVAVLAPAGPRRHVPPAANGIVRIDGADTPLAHSVVDDLDRDGLRELILAASGDSAQPLRLLLWTNQTFAQKPDGVGPGLERPVHITGMAVDDVVPGAEPRRGLLVSHGVQVDSFMEQRLSTLLVGSGPNLIAADSSLSLDMPIGGVVSGGFSQSSADLALASGGGPAGGALVILANDGLGTMSELSRTDAPGILPKTLIPHTLGPNPEERQGLAWLRDSAVLEVLVPVPDEDRMRQVVHDLGPFLPAHLVGLPVSGDSILSAGDVDGDGNQDLVVLLRFDGQGDPGEDDAALVVLRGRGADPPLLDPEAASSVHGRASAMALGDLVRENGAGRLLELAVAVPAGSTADPFSGNHVRFYRYDPSAGAFLRSPSGAEQALLAGSGPTQLVAADFSGNGVDDLLVCSSDGFMRLFVNRGVQVDEGEVNIDAFSTGSPPRILPPGEPTQMVLRDLNGDRVADVVVATEQHDPTRESSVAYYLRNALGDFNGPFLLPMTRTGNRARVGASTVPRNAAMRLCVADFNGDNRTDLAFGWDSAGPDDRNLRVLFGGSR